MRDRLRLLAFVFVVAAAFVALRVTQDDYARTLRAAQVKVCSVENNFRDAVNRQNQGFIAHNDVTLRLFIDLERLSPEPVVKAAFRRAIPTYRNITHLYTRIPQIDCGHAYPE